MKTLYLVRHAKAEDKSNPVGDFERKLVKKGINQARKTGEWLKSENILPELLVSSSANRASETAAIVAGCIGFGGLISYDKRLYCDSADELIDVLREIPENIMTVMLVGHNPSFDELLHYLCDTEIGNMPKGAVAAIRLNKTWDDLSAQCGTLLFLEKPD